MVSLYCTSVSAADPAPDKSLTPQTEALLQECNREAKNALINGAIGLVEKLCMQAISDIEKAEVDKEYLINPMMNLAFSYTLAGLFDKATPLYEKARNIRVELYGPDSKKLTEIDYMIKNQKAMKHQSPM